MPSVSPRPCEDCGQRHETWADEERCAGEPLHPCTGCGAPLGGDPVEVTLCADCIIASMRPLSL